MDWDTNRDTHKNSSRYLDVLGMLNPSQQTLVQKVQLSTWDSKFVWFRPIATITNQSNMWNFDLNFGQTSSNIYWKPLLLQDFRILWVAERLGVNCAPPCNTTGDLLRVREIPHGFYPAHQVVHQTDQLWTRIPFVTTSPEHQRVWIKINSDTYPLTPLRQSEGFVVPPVAGALASVHGQPSPRIAQCLFLSGSLLNNEKSPITQQSYGMLKHNTISEKILDVEVTFGSTSSSRSATY